MLPAYHPLDHFPPYNNLLPELVVTAKGTAFLRQPLRAKLSLRAGQPINLLPPSTATSPYWHLDVRPDALRNLDWYPGTCACIRRLPLPAGLLAPGQRLLLGLLPGEPEFAGFYPLLPLAWLPAPPPMV